MGYTKFGKIIRKKMIDNDENLGDIADLLNVSTSFVSAVLIGKKTVPEEWCELLSGHFTMNKTEIDELNDAYCESKKQIKIDISNFEIERKKLVLQFQRKLPELDDDELQSILNILGNEGE